VSAGFAAGFAAGLAHFLHAMAISSLKVLLILLYHAAGKRE
jgi:hypothetical protein